MRVEKTSNKTSWFANFERLWFHSQLDKEFQERVMELRVKWKMEEGLPAFNLATSEQIDKRINNFFSVKLAKGIVAGDKGKKIGIFEYQIDIAKLLDDFNFGREWETPLGFYLLHNKINPPYINAHLYESKIGKRKRIFIELNEFTSEKDLNNILKEFREKKKEVFSGVGRIYSRKNISRDIQILFQSVVNAVKSVRAGYNKRDRERYGMTDLGLADKFLGEVNLDNIKGDEDRKRIEIVKKARRSATEYYRFFIKIRE